MKPWLQSNSREFRVTSLDGTGVGALWNKLLD